MARNFIQALENKDFDYLIFDDKSGLWHLCKQPNIAPIYVQRDLFEFIKYFPTEWGDLGIKTARLFSNLRRSSYRLFYFCYKLNNWVACFDNDRFPYLIDRSFENLVERL